MTADERAYPELELPRAPSWSYLIPTTRHSRSAAHCSGCTLPDGPPRSCWSQTGRPRTRRTTRIARERVGVLELAAALTQLAVRPVVHRLGLPDAAVDRHEGELLERLSALVSATPRATVLAPHMEDVHRDHRACGRVADTIARKQQRRVLHYAVWLGTAAMSGTGTGRGQSPPTSRPSSWNARRRQCAASPPSSQTSFPPRS